MATKFGLAQPVRRVEDPRLLKGDGRYTDDIRLPNTAVGVLLRSPHAAARIVSVDTAAAKAVPGVVGVYTSHDLRTDGIRPMHSAVRLKNRDGSEGADVPHPILAEGHVRHVGDPVAFIVAEDLKSARDGAEAISVEYDIQSSVTELEAAMEPGQPQIWHQAKHNIAFDWHVGNRETAEELFAGAVHVTKLRVVNNRSSSPRWRRARHSPNMIRRRNAGRCGPTRKAAG